MRDKSKRWCCNERETSIGQDRAGQSREGEREREGERKREDITMTGIKRVRQ
jgi:hypothetical protein